MVVVAIIGILASIAIPNFLRYQLRAKTTEAVTNLKAISEAEEAYYAEYGTYVAVMTANPPTAPMNSRIPWPGGSDFDTLGWGPEGSVHFQYQITAFPETSLSGATATGSLDLFFVPEPSTAILGGTALLVILSLWGRGDNRVRQP